MKGRGKTNGYGKAILGYLGGKIGKYAGDKFGKWTGIHGDVGGDTGQKIGEELGSLLPFKKGGRVRKTGKILAHKGEFVLPKGVKPTAKQIQAVRKRGGRVAKKSVKKGKK
jgi:hypothetical protein